MALPDTNNKINGEDLFQEKLSKLQQGGDSQYIISALTSEILEKPEYSLTAVAGKSQNIITLNEDVNPFTFATYILRQGTSSRMKSIFNTFNNAQLTSLTPMIKFFLRGDDTKKIIPIPLQNMHNKVHDPLGSVNRRYSFLGIKQIDVDLSGNSPEVAKADIQSSVTFYGNNLSLFEKDGQGEHYLPLIVPYYKRTGEENQEANQYQLLMQVGWNIPSVGAKKGLKFTKEQMDAIKAQQVTYIMRYYKHGFSFNEDGSFQLKVDYVSAVDENMRDINFMEPSLEEIESFVSLNEEEIDAFTFKEKESSGAVKQAVNNFINTSLPAAGKNAKQMVAKFLLQKPDKDVFKEIEKLENKFAKRDSNKLKGLVSTLIKNRAGYTLEVTPGFVDNLYFEVVAANFMDEFYRQERMSGADKQKFIEDTRTKLLTANMSYDPGITIEQLQIEEETMSSEPPMMSTVTGFFEAPIPGQMMGVYHFFKLGDIITAFLQSSNGDNYLKENNMKIILGNMRFPTKNKGIDTSNQTNILTTSIYNIPISLDSLMKIIFDGYVNTTKRRLTLQNFISLLISKVVRPYFLEKDVVLDHRPIKGSIRTGQVIVPKSLADKINDNITESQIQALNLRGTRIEATGDDEDKLAMFYYLNMSSPSPPMDAKILESLDQYHIGSAGSIVKKVNFNQVNSGVQQARADDNVVASLRNENSTIIPQVYNVSMDLIGNINFYPGYSFHLHPTILGLSQDTKDSVLKTLGLTGTYMATKVAHSFSTSGFTTSLESYNVYVNKTIKDAADAQDESAEATTE